MAANATSNGLAARPAMNGHGSSFAAKHDLAPHFIGGNHLANAPPSKVRDFVQAHDGHTVITNVRLLRPVWLSRLQIRPLTPFSGAHRQQRYCRSQVHSLCAKMVLRELRRRARCPDYCHGNSRGFAG